MASSPPNVRVLMDRHELQDNRASDFPDDVIELWSSELRSSQLAGTPHRRCGKHQFNTITPAIFSLKNINNNVNDQILDLYPADNILSALRSRFVFAGFHSNPTADFWRLFWCR